MLLYAPLAFCADDSKQEDSGFNVALWVSICAAVGTLTTATVNSVRWFRERSAAARKLETVSYILKLKEFLDSEKSIGPRFDVESQSKIAAEVARDELRIALTKLDTTPQPISKVRQLLLLYAPRGWRAWIAHSLFYAGFMFFCIFVAAIFTGEITEFRTDELALASIGLAVLAIIPERWAALEHRISKHIVLKPKTVGYMTWYPANSRYAILAQVMLTSGMAHIASFIFGFFTTLTTIGSSMPFSPWESAFSSLLHSAFLPIGYCWVQMEFNYLERPERRTWSGFIRMIFRTRTAEQFVGLITLLVLTIWNLVLLLEVRRIPLFASFQDSPGGPEAAMTGAVAGFLADFFLVGWLPWLAVYRGLWTFYREEPKLVNAVNFTTSEGSNG